MMAKFIGNREIVDYFEHVLQEKRLGQAYLFWGADAVGKRYFAYLLSRSLLCKNNVYGGCGECKACYKVDKEIHPDMWVYEPANSVITIEQIRTIIQRLRLKPTESEYSIHIVDSVETMRVEAANAFLKIIEEPPLYALIILITTVINSLPATVRSRCQRINFNRIAHQDIYSYLIAQGIDKPNAVIISHWSDGSFSKAMAMDFEQMKAIRNNAVAILRAMIERNQGESFPDFLPPGFKRDKNASSILKMNFRDIVYFLSDLIREAVYIKANNKSLHHPDIFNDMQIVANSREV